MTDEPTRTLRIVHESASGENRRAIEVRVSSTVPTDSGPAATDAERRSAERRRTGLDLLSEARADLDNLILDLSAGRITPVQASARATKAAEKIREAEMALQRESEAE